MWPSMWKMIIALASSSQGRRKKLIWLLGSKHWSGRAHFFSHPLSSLQEAHILLCRNQDYPWSSATRCIYYWGSVWGSILAYITCSNKRLLHNTDNIFVFIGLIPLSYSQLVQNTGGADERYFKIWWGCLTWARSIGFSLLGVWVFSHQGTKSDWSRVFCRLCPGPTMAVSCQGLSAQLFVSERH